MKIFLTHGCFLQGATVWKYNIIHNAMEEHFASTAPLGECQKTYTLNCGALITSKARALELLVPLRRILVGLPRLVAHQGEMLSFIASFRDEIAIMAKYRWDNGKEMFDVTIGDLRWLLNKSNSK